MNTAPVVEFRALTRRFSGKAALDAITLDIPRGEVVGLIGRNGSGKSTLLNHVTGLLLPTSGECHTFGVSSRTLGAGELSRIGVVTQHGRLIDWMSAARLISHVAAFYDTWDATFANTMVKHLELDTSVQVGAMSPGVRQQLQLVLALAHGPDLVLLDEPLSDLDPLARGAVLELLLDVYERARPTIVISSHLLHDIEPAITRVVSLADGKVTANEELDALKERHGRNLEGLFPLLVGGGR